MTKQPAPEPIGPVDFQLRIWGTRAQYFAAICAAAVILWAIGMFIYGLAYSVVINYTELTLNTVVTAAVFLSVYFLLRESLRVPTVERHVRALLYTGAFLLLLPIETCAVLTGLVLALIRHQAKSSWETVVLWEILTFVLSILWFTFVEHSKRMSQATRLFAQQGLWPPDFQLEQMVDYAVEHWMRTNDIKKFLVDLDQRKRREAVILKELVSKASPNAKTAGLANATSLTIRESTVFIRFPRRFHWMISALDSTETLTLIQTILQEIIGKAVQVRWETEPEDNETP